VSHYRIQSNHRIGWRASVLPRSFHRAGTADDDWLQRKHPRQIPGRIPVVM